MDKKTLTSLFTGKAGQGLGISEDTSSLILAGLNAKTMPLCIGKPLTEEEMEADSRSIIVFVLDVSPSMEDVIAVLREELNTTMRDGLKEVSTQFLEGIRVGALWFSTEIGSVWKGFVPIAEMPDITAKNLPLGGEMTSLHQAQLDGITAGTGYAVQVRDQTKSNPKCYIVVLTDGGNNEPPHEPDAVLQVAKGLDPELFVLVLAGFKTQVDVDYHDIAEQTGFRNVFELNVAGESQEGKRRRFRHLLKLLSSSLVASTSKQVVGGGGFWQGDEEEAGATSKT